MYRVGRLYLLEDFTGKKWMMGVENIKKYNIILCLFNGAVNNSVYTVRSDCIVSKYAR